MKHKKLFIAMIAVFSVIVFFATFLTIWYWGDSYPDFKEFTAGVEIPGLDDGAVPQGIGNYRGLYSYTDEHGDTKSGTQDYFFMTAYMKDGPSRIYVTGEKTGYLGYVTMKNTDGTDFYGHAGGIAVGCAMNISSYGKIWVASEGKVYVAKKSANTWTNIAEEVIAKCKRGNGENYITFTASFDANCNADFCFYYDSDGNPSTISSNDRLYVGEYYRAGDKETDSKHHLTTKKGTQNKAFAYEYNISTSSHIAASPEPSAIYGLTTINDTSVAKENWVPRIQYIYSLPNEIQGFARIKGTTSDGKEVDTLVLSRSWGLFNSTISQYDCTSTNSTTTSIKYKGVQKTTGPDYVENNKTVCFVDDSALVRNYSIPSMSEGLCVVGNKVHVLFESASYKYRMFVRQQIRNVYYFVPKFVLKND